MAERLQADTKTSIKTPKGRQLLSESFPVLTLVPFTSLRYKLELLLCNSTRVCSPVSHPLAMDSQLQVIETLPRALLEMNQNFKSKER